MIRRPPRSTLSSSSAASDVYKRQSINKWHFKLIKSGGIRLHVIHQLIINIQLDGPIGFSNITNGIRIERASVGGRSIRDLDTNDRVVNRRSNRGSDLSCRYLSQIRTVVINKTPKILLLLLTERSVTIVIKISIRLTSGNHRSQCQI